MIYRGSEFSTADFIEENIIKKLTKYEGRSIAQALLTHPHHDHISDCAKLDTEGELNPSLLTCPNDKDPSDGVDWERIKNIDGNASLKLYRKLFKHRIPPLQTMKPTSTIRPVADLEYGIYYIRPKVCAGMHSDNNEYGNALSIMMYFRYGNNSVLLPGDMTPEGMTKVLNQTEGAEKRFTTFSTARYRENPKWTQVTGEQPSFRSMLSSYGLSVLVAPHHGLESCYSSDLYAAIKGGKPDIVAISEREKTSANQGSIHRNYQSKEGATGLKVRVNNVEPDSVSYSVTTKGGHILVRMNGQGKPKVYKETRIENLLKRANE